MQTKIQALKHSIQGHSSFEFIFGAEIDPGKSSYVISNAERFWKIVNYTTMGQCFTFVPPHWIKLLQVFCNKTILKSKLNYHSHFPQISEITFIMKVATLVYVHHNGQFTNPDMNDKIALKLGQRLYLQILHDVRTSLSVFLQFHVLFASLGNICI